MINVLTVPSELQLEGGFFVLSIPQASIMQGPEQTIGIIVAVFIVVLTIIAKIWQRKQTTTLLLGPNDIVRLAGLSSAAQTSLNGKQGAIVGYDAGKQHYLVAVEERGTPVASKRANLELVKRAFTARKNSLQIHVLIPCHIESQRRLVTFMRCAKSLAMQTETGFSVFVGLSGPEEFRTQCTSFLCLVASKCPRIQWHVLDENVEKRSQFEHLRHLLPVSEKEASTAWLMFLDSDDMCHPTRIQIFKEIAQDTDRPDPNGPFSVPCKLLLDDSVTSKEGELEQLFEHGRDFDKWKSNPGLRGKVRVATADSAHELDADEFFDFCVPSATLRAFMELTPVEITRSQWCDLRFHQMLKTLSVLEPMDVGLPWLLAHYKTRMETKLAAFDNSGAAAGSHAQDQASMAVKCEAEDAELAAKYGRLQPAQVAMCRGHVESAVIQHCVWDPDGAAAMKRHFVGDLDKSYARGFGAELWERSSAKLEGCFSRGLAQKNRAWYSHAANRTRNGQDGTQDRQPRPSSSLKSGKARRR